MEPKKLLMRKRAAIQVASSLVGEEWRTAWRISLGGQINIGPITYAVNGKQYVALNSGKVLFVFGLKE